ncbi:MAG TPA: DoxX family protein [Pseudolabrys sp.]|jgi:uncharacterized membrane protein YphA (DoxX/SURF4 family)|nr:DoxX family protein [Pseudolabrys sp.]
MRTNPFSDAWLFLIGATDDHRALGAFQYVMVALFWALLFASVWIAFKSWSEDPEQRRAGPAITWICRLLIGAQWFQGCLWKLPFPVSGGFQYWTGQMGEHAAFEFHRTLVKNVFLPHLNIIDPLVFLAELAFAVSLMLGIGVRLVATIAAFYSLHLWLGLYRHPAEWPWNYMFLAIVHVQFAVYAAGRSLGLDALIRRRPTNNAITRLAVLAG